MATGPILRFVDPANTASVRLDLRNRSGWYAGEGINVGRPGLAKKLLTQDGVNGAELASAWYDGLVTMNFELLLMPQANASAMETLVNALNTELRRTTNGIEYLPHGLTGTTWIFDTFRADEIVLQEGDGFSPWVRPANGLAISFDLQRLPDVRGRSTSLA